MAAYTEFKFGTTVFPLVSPGADGTLLSTCDASLEAALDYWEAMLNRYLGTALIDVCSSAFAPITSNVAYKTPIDPTEIMREVQLQFPLLAVWRKSSTIDERTANWDVKASRWGVAYVLPPLSGGQLERISPVLNAVESILINRTRQAFDPTYLDGAQIWKNAGIDTISFRSSSFGRFEFGDNMDFHAWTAELDVDERVTPYTGGLNPLTGSDIQIFDNSVQPGNPVDLVDLKTDVPV